MQFYRTFNIIRTFKNVRKHLEQRFMQTPPLKKAVKYKPRRMKYVGIRHLKSKN